MSRFVAILLSLSSLSAFAQVDKTVLPIAKYGFILHGTFGPGVGFEVGTGFCLDLDCRFVGTNYHVAKEMGKHVKIKGEPIVNRYFATSQNDEGAISNRLVMSLWRFKYNPARDLAVLELKQPLSKKKYHGMPYSLDDLKPNQEVDIWAYPMQNPSPKRRLLKFHARFVSVSKEGMLAFRYEVVDGGYIVGGASGGIVVDSCSGKIVGILSAVDSKYPVALAVPVKALADFVNKVQPYLGAQIFPNTVIVPPIAPDIYSPWKGKNELSQKVALLRQNAKDLSDSMRHFIAVQSYEWGKDNERPTATAKYEVRITEGRQKFRELDKNRELDEPPVPPITEFLIPGGEWSSLPLLVGADYYFDIHQAPDIVKDNLRFHVFQYWGTAESGACQFKTYFPISILSHVDKVDCDGEVWTDAEMHILRMSENYALRGRWKRMHAIVTYDWVKIENNDPRLLPVTIAAQVEDGKHILWCRGLFTDYQVFTVKSRILP